MFIDRLTDRAVNGNTRSKSEQSCIVPNGACGKALGVQIDALSWEDALNRLLAWAHSRDSRYVCICNVHVVVTASRDAAYRKVIDGSDMATPGGAAVAWMLRRQGFAGQPRISGPDLMRCAGVWRCPENEGKMWVMGAALAKCRI